MLKFYFRCSLCNDLRATILKQTYQNSTFFDKEILELAKLAIRTLEKNN